MSHFLEISRLTQSQLLHWVDRALQFKTSGIYPSYPQETVANLFYENSTRTRVSFELAAKRLGMTVVNLDLATSSETKGETVEDTLSTLQAMGINNFVIRHRQNRLPMHLADKFGDKLNIINAGDGQCAHPSQALLDLMTIVEHKPHLSSLKAVIIGDLRHSRVANSFQCLVKEIGLAELVLVSPAQWKPEHMHYGRWTDNLKEALVDADVIMTLRIQNERLASGEEIDLKTYRDQFSLTQTQLRLAKPDAIVMHPGPINRGVEIDDATADSAQSVILQQVGNGVFARMAILEAVVTA